VITRILFGVGWSWEDGVRFSGGRFRIMHSRSWENSVTESLWEGRTVSSSWREGLIESIWRFEELT